MCKGITDLRPKFIIEMYKELKEAQIESITNETLWVMVNDIQKYLWGVQDNNEYQTNQYFIGMKQLFREFTITT